MMIKLFLELIRIKLGLFIEDEDKNLRFNSDAQTKIDLFNHNKKS